MAVENRLTKDISALEEKLAYQNALHAITVKIHAAQNLRQILVDLKDDILTLFDAQSATIYVADRERGEIYSMFLTGTKLGEIRVPMDGKSIAGFTAQSQKLINIRDAYDKNELKAISKDLAFDEKWDRKSGFKTTQVLAMSVLYEGNLMGVVQIINKKGGGVFSEQDVACLTEISSVLGIAFHNQQKVARRRRTRFDYLVSRGFLKEEELNVSWEEARKSNELMEEFLMKKFKISKEDIGKSLENFFNCKFVQFSDKFLLREDLFRNLKQEFLRREFWVPLEKNGNVIRVAIDDPNNLLKRDMIENLLKTKSIEYCVVTKPDIIKFINHFFRVDDSQASINEILGKLEYAEEIEDEEDESISESDSAIMQLVNKIINDASVSRASDIHIEPNTKKKNVDIRFRIDGECVNYQTVPYSYRAATVSRIKIMSNLDITERRLPQDGKIKFKKGGGDLELRVATIPTQGGVEDVVMRLLAKGETMGLEQMNMSDRNLQNFISVLDKPYGIILAVGPTGSGKTTTLHAALHHLNTPDTKIWTAEDPVEITQEGLRQVQVNPKIGFDFSHAMRAFLRADPDVIMVGEMRDYETAKIGVEASLTGHLVLSTLHTNSAPETIVRLLDMGIDPFNFADSLLGVLAQRLIRVLCKSCKEAYKPTEVEIEEIRESYGRDMISELNLTDGFTLYRPKGCPQCNNTGFKGRMGIHELLVVSDPIKKMIAKREGAEAIRNIGVEEGMRTLLQDGIMKVLAGHTDLKQVLSVCMR
jgi:type II secretory ATPase GspE/PulE/Tfp pilus assembly ATPase PilB-like protein